MSAVTLKPRWLWSSAHSCCDTPLALHPSTAVLLNQAISSQAALRFIRVLIEQTCRTPRGMQLREAPKCKLPLIYLRPALARCANVERRCYGVHCLALPATQWVCPRGSWLRFCRFGPRALDSLLEEGSSHLKSENKPLKSWRGPKKKKEAPFGWRDEWGGWVGSGLPLLRETMEEI